MKYKLYMYMMAAFVCVLMISNTVAVKVTPIGPFVFTAGIVVFPISYVLGDVITEVYGYGGARRIIWVGIIANVFMALIYAITAAMPSIVPDFGPMYASVLSQVPRLVLASTFGLWAGQFTNAFVMSTMKKVTKGRFLWTRTISSTFFGESIDTAFFVTIAFAGVLPATVIFQMVISAALAKTLYETLITPITYIVVNWVKKVEGIDTIDYKVSYNPFSFAEE